MDGKDRFDALMQLAEFRLKRIADRRSHEWKVTIGVWALLATGLISFEAPEDASASFIAIAFWSLVLLWLAHSAWVCRHWHRSRKDAQFGFYYTDNAEHVISLHGNELLGEAPIALNTRLQKPPAARLRRYIAWCWERIKAVWDWLLVCGVQILTTAILAFALWYVKVV